MWQDSPKFWSKYECMYLHYITHRQLDTIMSQCPESSVSWWKDISSLIYWHILTINRYCLCCLYGVDLTKSANTCEWLCYLCGNVRPFGSKKPRFGETIIVFSLKAVECNHCQSQLSPRVEQKSCSALTEWGSAPPLNVISPCKCSALHSEGKKSFSKNSSI